MGVDPAASLTHYITVSGLLDSVHTLYNELQNQESGDVSAWMDLMRTVRQPQILWSVDYLEPKEELLEINNLIRESEEIIFESSDSITLKTQYSAPATHQAAFNTIRMHLKAEEGNIDGALKILQKTNDELYDDLSDIRKSNLLFHSCLVFLCCKKFAESHDCFDKHWSLNKYSSPDKRISLGLVDNQTLLQLVYWFFIKYSDDFQDFYLVRNGVKRADVWNHKKISLLYFMEYDCAWVASLCGLPFYNHAKTWAPLPAYEKKRSTPTNFRKIWMDKDVENFDPGRECSGAEKKYFEFYNREINAVTITDTDKADDYLHSYYYYQINHAEMTNTKWQLLEFTKQHIDLQEVDSVLDVGAGAVETPILSQRPRYHVVDISEKICEQLRQRSISCSQSPISIFVSQTSEKFELCFACDVLPHLNISRLELFLKKCTCPYISAMMDVRDNFKSDILSSSRKIDQINLHRTVQSAEAWVDLFEKHYEVISSTKDHWVYVFGKRK